MTLVLKPGLNLQSPTANDPLLDLNTQPSLDLQFATSKTLDDAVSGTNLITFSRASSGTYVGSDGLIKTSVVNLFTYSEQFDQSAWSKNSSTITPNTTVSPDGTQTADTLTINTGETFGRLSKLNLGLPSGVYTISYYLKNTINQGTHRVFFLDPANNQYGVTVKNFSGDSTPEWTRFTATVDCSASGLSGLNQIRINFRPIPSPSDGTNTVDVWGAQLEEGSTATDYIPTTTTISGAPRFDHDPVTGESLGLLIEESRTNQLLYSEQFDNIAWTKSLVTVTSNAIVAPDGVTTADKLTATNTANESRHIRQDSSIVAGKSYTQSVFAKAGEITVLQIAPSTKFTNDFQNFDLSTGQLGSGGSGSATIEPYPNGWYRCSMTRDSVDSDGQGRMLFAIVESATSGRAESFQADAGDGLYLWGSQLETGSSTSYIPTSGTTVTRATDVASITGTNFSSWYNQSEGTVFADASAANTAINQYILHTHGASPNNNRSAYYLNSSNRPSAAWINSGTTQALLQSATPVSGFEGAAFKYVAAYNTNDFVVGYNGGSLISLTSGTPDPTINVARIGSFGGSIYILNGHIKRLAYFPTRKTDQELIDLTT